MPVARNNSRRPCVLLVLENHFYAVEGVKKIGNATLDKLRDTEIVLKRLVDVFAGPSHERRERAYSIIADVIKNIDSREQIGALYTEANRRLMFELGYPQ